MTAHTPGPWTYEVHELSEGYSGIVYDANGYRVGTDHLTEADARLIATAPDMLAALKAALPFISDTRVHQETRAAIAKAERAS